MDSSWLDALLSPSNDPFDQSSLEMDDMMDQFLLGMDPNSTQLGSMGMRTSHAMHPFSTMQPVVATGLQAATNLAGTATQTNIPSRSVTTGFGRDLGMPAGLPKTTTFVPGVSGASVGMPPVETSALPQPARGVLETRDSTLSSEQDLEPFLATKEKNKRAQKRFRERQKARLVDSEAKAAEYGNKLSQLEAEKLQLESRVKILEKLLALRSEDTSCAALMTSSQPPVYDEVSGPPYLPGIGYDNKGVGTVGCPLNTVLMLNLQGQDRVFSKEQVQNMTWTELCKIWKEYVNKIAMLLVSAETTEDSEVEESIKKAVRESYMLCAWITLLNPRLLRMFETYKLVEDTSREDASEPGVAWEGITKSLNLTAQQKREMLILRTYFVKELEKHLKERDDIRRGMLVDMPTILSQVPLAKEYLQAMTAVDAMNKNLRNDHQLQGTLLATVWGKLLEPIQIANAMVQAYPRFPDTLAILNCVAVEAGEPAAQLPGSSGCSTGSTAITSSRS